MLSVLRRSHRPDIDGLSAYVDGRLTPPRAAEVEAHLASCEACRARVGELRQVRSALASLPQAEAPRSFRLQSWQVVQPTSQRHRTSGFVYAAPALGFAAAVALIVLVGVDLSRGSAGNQASSGSRNYAFSQGAPVDSADMTRSADAATAQSIAGAGAVVAAPALATPPAAMLQGNANSPAAPPPAPEKPATAADAFAPKGVGAAASPTAGAANEARSAPSAEAATASSQQQGTSNSSGTDWLRIGEIIAACVAVGAVAVTAGMWKLRRDAS